LAIVLSVLLRYTESDCPFGVFKLFLQNVWYLLLCFSQSSLISEIKTPNFLHSSICTVTWCVVDLEALWCCLQLLQSPSPHSEHQMSDTFEMWRVKHTPQSGIGFDIVWKYRIILDKLKHII
jgi:hypothetical protein